jgi:hypothetical protein
MSRLTFDSKDASGYEQVLNHVRQLTTALQSTIDGRQSGRSQQSRACLIDLHNRTRGIAAVLNQALGACRDVDD